MIEVEKKFEGRKYLVGDTFSRADLSFASMLSLIVKPTEHPFPWGDIPDPEIRSFYNDYDDHPVCRWVSKIYKEHRLKK